MTIKCRLCELDQEIIVDPVKVQQWRDNRNMNGPMIQQVFPELTPSEREMLLSQTCGTCWEQLFKENEEEDPTHPPE